jgi:hypothetical protein
VARTCLTSALAGKADASDLVQETLIKAQLRQLSRLERGGIYSQKLEFEGCTFQHAF